MKNSFFSLPTEEQAELIKLTGDYFNMPDMIIEKDLWVCWLLEKLFELPIQMAFKGGTSLSKVYGLIKRFSEDCDITIDYRNFQSSLEFENLSRSQLKKVGAQLKKNLKDYVAETILPYLNDQISKLLPEQKFEITLSEDSEQLRFYYPSVFSISHGYLRDYVFIEFGVRNSTEPCQKLPVSPYLSQVIRQEITLPTPKVNTLSPIRTFWEKSTLMHVECNRDRLIDSPERLSRHWYDLFMLYNSWVGEKALLDTNLLKNVLAHKKSFYNASYANYDDCLSGKFRLIPSTLTLKSLQQDFDKMIQAGMFHEEPPSFELIIETLQALEAAINSNHGI